MSENLYVLYNCATPTTASVAPSTLPAAASVLLQVEVPVTRQIAVVEYGFSCSGAPAAIPIDLRVTTTAATLATAGTIYPYSNYDAPTSLCPSATTGCAFINSSTAVAPAATVHQIFDAQLLTTNTYIKQFPLAREPMAGNPTGNQTGAIQYVQLVCTAGVAATCLCYIVWRE
jgi:hypothetical protein